MANMDLDAYKKALEDKSEVPSFAPAVKTQYSRNITVEDWNSIVYSIQGLLSDVSATVDFLLDACYYQPQYSMTNVRGYSLKTYAEADLENLSENQLVIVNKSPLNAETEMYVVKTGSDGKYLQLASIGEEGNKNYYVYKTLAKPNIVQNVYTGLTSYYTDTDGNQVNYGTEAVSDGNGFFAYVLDKSSNYTGKISLGAKVFEFLDTQSVKFLEMDNTSTYLRAPNASSWVQLGTGEINIVGNKITFGNSSTPTTYVFNGINGKVSTVGFTFSCVNGVEFSYPPSCSATPAADEDLTNKKYVDGEIKTMYGTAKAYWEAGDNLLQTQIDAINASQNFVATYATEKDLPTAPQSGIMDGDCALVLKDSTHNNQSTVYKWTLPNVQWLFVGELGDYYTKAYVDNQFAVTNGNVAYYKSQTEAYASRVDEYERSTDGKITELGKVVDTAKDAYLASTPTFVETSSSTEESDITPTLVGLFAETGSSTQLSE